MSEMIERVAEAIGCIDADRCTRQRTAPSKRTKWQMKPCDLCMDAARNAIQAMREPTEGMIDAAKETVSLQVLEVAPDLPGLFGAWHAMIDHALKP